MEWIEKIGDFFNTVTSPIDTLMAWLVQLAVEALGWALGSILDIMKISDTFYDVQVTKDLFAIVKYACFLLAGAIFVYYIFSVLLDFATGGTGESPEKVIGKAVLYSYRILSMPFFLFTYISLNSKFIDVISTYGVSPDKLLEAVSYDSTDSTAFLKRIGGIFKVPTDTILMSALFALLLAFVFVALLFQLIRRTGDVFFLYILIPPVALTVFTRDLDMYPSWIRQLVSVIGGQAVQVIGIYAGMQMIIESHGIIGSGILLATISTPAVIKEFAYNSGASNNLRQGLSTGLLMLAR